MERSSWDAVECSSGRPISGTPVGPTAAGVGNQPNIDNVESDHGARDSLSLSTHNTTLSFSLSESSLNMASQNTRKSSRLAKQRISYAIDLAEPLENCHQLEPPRKRTKKTTVEQSKTLASATVQKQKRRGNRGMLQQLTQFPLDVLFEVFISAAISFSKLNSWLNKSDIQLR